MTSHFKALFVKSIGASFLLLSAGVALATPCGSVSSPTTCSVTVGGSNELTYTFTDFAFLNTAQTGTGPLYQAGDVLINVASGGGLSGIVSFSKNPNGPTPGIVFAANAGESSGITFSYTLTLTANVPGSASLISMTNSIQSSNLGNGIGADQLILSPVNCLATTITPSQVCALSGGTTASAGNILTVTGNTGNASIGTVNNLFNATFTPDTSGVPEPATYGLIGAGLLALRFLKRRV